MGPPDHDPRQEPWNDIIPEALKRIHKLVAGRPNAKELTKELFQDSFVKYVSGIRIKPADRSVDTATFIVNIARSLLYHRRSFDDASKAASYDSLNENVLDLNAYRPSLEDDLARISTLRAFFSFVEQRDPRASALARLMLVEGLRSKEAATAMRISEDALQRLRGRLQILAQDFRAFEERSTGRIRLPRTKGGRADD